MSGKIRNDCKLEKVRFYSKADSSRKVQDVQEELGDLNQYLVPLFGDTTSINVESITTEQNKCCRESVAKAVAKTAYDWAKFSAKRDATTKAKVEPSQGFDINSKVSLQNVEHYLLLRYIWYV